ncbi:MAG: hypothetical protein ACE141_08210 [Bryobacteraceae bacterium]
MSFTVVPLHNLSLPSGTRAIFGNGFVFQDVPQWVKNEPILKDLSRHDRQSVLDAKHALVAEYDAPSIGHPDPTWRGKKPRGIQEAKREAAILADNPDDARALFRKVKTCYKMRSTIIHGRWKDAPEIVAVMADTEGIVRTVFRRLLDDKEMLRTFISRHRNEFLEDWVFSRSTDTPPYPQP